MNRALIFYAHPLGDSFAAALHQTVISSLTSRGWDVDDCDLYKEGFDPVLSPEERSGYHDETTNTRPVQTYVDRLRAADALILCFPVWNFGYPAILKGVFDRVFLPGVSFKLIDGKVRPNLTHIKKVAAVCTYGGTRLRAFGAGDPPRKLVTRHLWHVTRPATMKYLALYDMNRATEARRKTFQAKVAREMEIF